MKLSVLLAAATASLLLAITASAELTARDIMDKQKKRHELNQEQETVLMRLVDKRGNEKERTMAMYSLKDSDGLNKSMIKFLSPRDISNVGLLTWERAGDDDDQWLYLPASGKVKRIASSGKKNKFMGTDLSFEDLRPENLDVHTYTLTGSETVDGHDCYVIEALPSTDEEKKSSGYSKRRIWIDKELLVGRKSEFYGRRGKLIKTSVVHEIENVKGDVWRAKKSTVADVKRDTSTILETQERTLDAELTDSFFTQRQLKKKQ